MNITIKYFLLFGMISILLIPTIVVSQRSQPDNFRGYLEETLVKLPGVNSGIYLQPKEDDLMHWSKIIHSIRMNLLDSCRDLLTNYNYELVQFKDAVTENVYDIIREKYPIQYGWGTYIYNHGHKRRLHIEINHPFDDPQALIIGGELFRRLNCEWMLIGGTSRKALAGNLNADMGRMRQTVFERWHETLSNLTYVTLSIHSYDETVFPQPINSTDVIVSNGSTSDQQWGISQLSLAFRDTMRAAGYWCGLAMYDSGYARLAGGWNTQGTFSNDSMGFGHWLYLEISKKIRLKMWEYPKLVAALERALDLTGRKISQQVNKGFGLVSPRIIKLDSSRKLFFPQSPSDTYRIVSFDPKKKITDTLTGRMGQWRNVFGKKNGSSVTILDSSQRDFLRALTRSSQNKMVSKIIESPRQASSIIRLKDQVQDTSSYDTDEESREEPIQVHRIPLEPVFENTFVSQTELAPYKWEGVITGWFAPSIPTFDLSEGSVTEGLHLPRFLIPLVNSSFSNGKKSFLGIQMTTYLVDEIARLVNEYEITDRDIGLIAEQSSSGEYYIRIIPTGEPETEIAEAIK
ncbi:MAG: hypothetical protein HZB59_04140 [Ignavibacteriales bacterium]|nr:hypothetical protein [Ignavibacteriales bacterium]